MSPPHIQVILKNGFVPPALSAALERAGAEVIVNGFEDACLTEADSPTDAVVVVVPHSDQHDADGEIEHLFSSLAKNPCGTLVLVDGSMNGLSSVARPPGLPISFAENPSEDELTARLATICEYGESLRHMNAEAEDLKRHGKRIAAEVQQLDEQLRLASQVQRDFLPRRIPRCDDVRFVTLFRPTEHVSGDIYDITRLDETHIGISVADVTGHGIPAALLTLFVKRAWRAKEIKDNSYRIIPPDELLYRLNSDVLEADLQQCQFVTACCSVYDHSERIITWARGGLPYPILVRPGQTARSIRSKGELLGAFEDVYFESCSEQLLPGDTMLFLSDGIEALLLGGPGSGSELLEQTEWFTNLGQRPIDDDISEINQLIDETPPDRWPCDDVTIVAVCVSP